MLCACVILLVLSGIGGIGRHEGLKHPCSKERTGSNPVSRTKELRPQKVVMRICLCYIDGLSPTGGTIKVERVIMNIFVVESDPYDAAVALCDKHVPKMAVESVQMLVSSLLRNGADPKDMPLTAKGAPHKGGYPNHPSTRWVGDSRSNYEWLYSHAEALVNEFRFRFGKVHACAYQLSDLIGMQCLIPEKGLTQVALCVGEKFQKGFGGSHAPLEDAIHVYREFYKFDKLAFAEWNRGRNAPLWWIS